MSDSKWEQPRLFEGCEDLGWTYSTPAWELYQAPQLKAACDEIMRSLGYDPFECPFG